MKIKECIKIIVKSQNEIDILKKYVENLGYKEFLSNKYPNKDCYFILLTSNDNDKYWLVKEGIGEINFSDIDFEDNMPQQNIICGIIPEVGKVYYAKTITGKNWIVKYTGIDGNNNVTSDKHISINSFYLYNSVSWCNVNKIETFRLATNEEIKWLEACIKFNKFIPKEEALKSKKINV